MNTFETEILTIIEQGLETELGDDEETRLQMARNIIKQEGGVCYGMTVEKNGLGDVTLGAAFKGKEDFFIVKNLVTERRWWWHRWTRKSSSFSM